MEKFDFVVIGGGSGGDAAASTAATMGLSTLLIEGGSELGGLCILKGCMPSKTLIESANRYLSFRHAADFGLSAENIGFNGEQIIARKRRMVGDFADFRSEQIESGKFDLLRGHAEFLDPYSVRVDQLDGNEKVIQLRSACIATGSVINRPPVRGMEVTLSSDDLLEMTKIPHSAIVLGGGPVALEMAHYLESLGSMVTILQRNKQLLTGSDRDLADSLADAFRNRGMTVNCGVTLLSIESISEGARVFFKHGSREYNVEADMVFNALGRSPAIKGLGLSKAGVTVRDNAIVADMQQRTTAPHLFAAGDCCGPYEVVHMAVIQGETAARNAATLLRGGKLVTLDYRLKLFACFTEPQMASCGLTEHEAREAGISIISASYPFADHGKSIVKGETEGFVKLIADASDGRILGGAVVGPDGSEIIHEIVVAMSFHATAGQLAVIPHYHPTLSEIWTYPAEEIAGKVNKKAS